MKLETFKMSKLQLQQQLSKIRHDLLQKTQVDRCRVYIVDVCVNTV
jgi:hypothetical protein